MIRAVIFDFGNVLCFPPAPEKISLAAAFCKLPEHEFLESFWKERLTYDGGKLTPLAYWTTVVGAQFADAHLQKLIDIEVDFWTDYDERPFRWIEQLRASGVKVGLLSNLPEVLADDLRKKHFMGKRFLDHFDHVTFSYELRMVKPQAGIYQHSAQGVGVAPQETLFLDDKLPNVQGAIHVGLRAELFTTWEDFLARDVPSLYGLLQSP